MFAQVFNFTPTNPNSYYSAEFFAIFLQQLVVYSSVMLLILFFVSILVTNIFTKSSKFSTMQGLLKYLMVTVLSFIFFCVLFKFTIYLLNFKRLGSFMSTCIYTPVNFVYLFSAPTLNLSGSTLSDVTILLAFSSGLICIYLLGEKNMSKYGSNITFFSIFLVAIVLMVYTVNLLVMFIGFEFLFLPTLYYVYSHGYVQRSDKTLRILLYWTLFGAFLVLCSLSYLYFKYKTLNYFELNQTKFTSWENTILYLTLFIGFGIKVPVFPFHYWLTKIHVEAPAGFSIFLSGFLVKAAIYCFYYFNIIFETQLSIQLVTLVAFLGIIDSSVKMWTQTDFKKLIAFATIQEMNLILFLLINLQNTFDYSLLLFILIHGWLSTLMFFLVDVIQKKTSSRNILEISGLAYTFSNLKFIIWFIVLLFSGFPLTVKFIIEWQVVGALVAHSTTLLVFIFFIIVVIGVVGFAKQMIIILYGIPRHQDVVNHTLSKRDKHLFYYIIWVLLLLNLLNFTLG